MTTSNNNSSSNNNNSSNGRVLTKEVKPFELFGRISAKMFALLDKDTNDAPESWAYSATRLSACALDVMLNAKEYCDFKQTQAFPKDLYDKWLNKAVKRVKLDINEAHLPTAVCTTELKSFLEKAGYIKSKGKKVFLGPEYKRINKPVTKGYLKLASEGVTDANRRKKGERKDDALTSSKLAMKVLEAQEKMEMIAIPESAELAKRVYQMVAKRNKISGKQALIKDQDRYSLMAVLDHITNGNEKVVAEYMNDSRFRMYQVDTFGVNGQSSDMVRSLTGYANATLNYTPSFALVALMKEMKDMVSCSDAEFEVFYNMAITDPDNFCYDTLLAKGLHKQLRLSKENNSELSDEAKSWRDQLSASELAKSNKTKSQEKHLQLMLKVKKPFSFVLLSNYRKQLLAHVADPVNVKKPIIRCGFGLDATGSGPQLNGLMVADLGLMKANGFAVLTKAQWDQVNDAYERCIELLEADTFFSGKLSRADVKTAFMAIFYGMGYASFMDVEGYTGQLKDIKRSDLFIQTLDGHEAKLFDFLSDNGKNLEVCGVKKNGEQKMQITETAAMKFHSIVVESFGKPMFTLMKAMKDSYTQYDRESDTSVLKEGLNGKTPTYALPDGAVVRQKYRKFVSFNGYIMNAEQAEANKKVELNIQLSNKEDITITNVKYKTKEVNYADCGRTSHVNFTHAVDGLLARLILNNLVDLGVQCFTSVHDCFRVDIESLEKGHLEKSISCAYNQLFGSKNKNEDAVFTDVHGKKCTGDDNMLPLGTDLTGLYFRGIKASTGAEFKNFQSQFDTDTGVRLLQEKAEDYDLVKTGESFVESITSKLGEDNGKGNAYATFFKK